MASERQIAANLRNSRKSTGPKFPAGKKRSSRNSYRHGLSLPLGPELQKYLNSRAQEIAGAVTDNAIPKAAIEVAAAEYQLVRVRRARVAIIERAMGSDDPPRRIGLALGHLRLQSDPQSERSMSSQDQDRTAEAIQRVLPELCKLERYERRAASTLYRAVRRFRHKQIG